MAEHSVIDANCWSEFVDERLRDVEGVATRAYSLAQSVGTLLFDDGLQIRQQYVQVKRGFGESLFDDFFEQGVLAGSVRLTDARADQALKRILDGLGVPRGEHIYFRAAKSGGADHIVSEDIDFFDPAMKKRGQEQKDAVKRDRSGCVCREFGKNHGILIHCMEGFVEHVGS